MTGTSLDRAAVKQLTLAVAAGAAASVAAIALTATSAWLISRASQRPPVLSLTVAVVAVQAFALARSVFRYLERLVSHDAALRVLATIRVTAYRRLLYGVWPCNTWSQLMVSTSSLTSAAE